MNIFLRFIMKVELVLEILLGLRFVISWVAPRMNNAFTDIIYSLTEPLLRPFRSIVVLGNIGIDLAPIILIFIIRMLRTILVNAIVVLFY